MKDVARPSCDSLRPPNQDAGLTLVRLPKARGKFGLSRSTFLDMVKRGLLPQPVRISKRCVAWVESELDEVIAARIAERAKAAA